MLSKKMIFSLRKDEVYELYFFYKQDIYKKQRNKGRA